MLTILLGPPGAGKGTIAGTMSNLYNYKHISTGNILREAIEKNTTLGKKAALYMDRGDLVPDEIMLGLIRVALSADVLEIGVILDGYPRNLTQAKYLDTILSELGITIDHVAYIDVDKEEIVKRILNRRTCSNTECQSTYNLHYKPPRIEGRCDRCQAELTIRSDETEEIISNRLVEYQMNTAPLISYYREARKLKEYKHPDSSVLAGEIINEIIGIVQA